MNFPSSSLHAVPSIRIHGADDASSLFDASEFFPSELCNNLYNAFAQDSTMYPCAPGSQQPSFSSNASSELEEMPEFLHLNTTQMHFTGYDFSTPYSGILQENGAVPVATGGALSPAGLGSPMPSPTSTFGGSLSPSSLYDSALSDTDSPLSPTPITPDEQFPWTPQGMNHSPIGSFSNDSVHPCGSLGPHRPRSQSSPSSRRGGPVASKAMLEANGRRRRHPAPHECPECKQTFTALFSLKRHRQSHTGERPFACGIPGCTQRFYNSSDCKRHEKSKKRHKDLLMQ